MIELEVITGIEQDVAKLHGDIKEDEVTRKNHSISNLFILDTRIYGLAAEYYREEIIDKINKE